MERSEVVGAIKSSKPPKNNISCGEKKALQDLKSDESIIILPADKGRATVVLNKQDYHEKITTLLSDTNTYEKLEKDPTGRYKRKLVNKLSTCNKEGKFSTQLYHKIYATSEAPPKLYGLPKIHKTGYPLRPIVSSIGSVTYPIAEHLAEILNPLVGKTEHHVLNSKHFVEMVKDTTLTPEETLVSFDVSALFTSVPVAQAVRVIKTRLEEEDTLHKRTKLNVEDIVDILDLVLSTTYFVYNECFYKQTHRQSGFTDCG